MNFRKKRIGRRAGRKLTAAAALVMAAFLGCAGNRTALFLTSYAETALAREALSAADLEQRYSYEALASQAAAWKNTYSELLTVESLGTSEGKRALLLLSIGNLQAEHHILVIAGLTGADYAGSLLALNQAGQVLMAASSDITARSAGEDDAAACSQLLSQVCIHVLPMANPDGVTRTLKGKKDKTKTPSYGNFLTAEVFLEERLTEISGVQVSLADLFSGKSQIALSASDLSLSGQYCTLEAAEAALTLYQMDFVIQYQTGEDALFWDSTVSGEAGTLSYAYMQALSKENGYEVRGQMPEEEEKSGLTAYVQTKLGKAAGILSFLAEDGNLNAAWAKNRNLLLTLAHACLSVDADSGSEAENASETSSASDSQTDVSSGTASAVDAAALSGIGTTESSGTSQSETAQSGTSQDTEVSIEYFEQAQEYQIVNCNYSVTLRDSPAFEGNEICQISLGEVVLTKGLADSGFYLVVYGDDTGYVCADYMEPYNQEEAQEEEQDGFVVFKESRTYQVANCNYSITLRTNPSFEGSEICQIPLGELVSAEAKTEDNFYLVEYNGLHGYVYGDYLSAYSGSGQ